MKYILSILLVVWFCSCSKSDDNTPKKGGSEIDKLPPISAVGANTIGCLVDGEAFLPYGDFMGSGGNPRCDYIELTLNLSFFTYYKSSKSGRMLVIGSQKELLVEGRTYSLEKLDSNNKSGKFRTWESNTIGVNFESTAGELYIARFDRILGIVSGTFWFDAVNMEGEKVEIREGRFDMKYYGN